MGSSRRSGAVLIGRHAACRFGAVSKIPLSIYSRMVAHDVQCNRRRVMRRGWGAPINKRSLRPWQRSGTPPLDVLRRDSFGYEEITARPRSRIAAPPRALDAGM